jgi:hypothetical protein
MAPVLDGKLVSLRPAEQASSSCARLLANVLGRCVRAAGFWCAEAVWRSTVAPAVKCKLVSAGIIQLRYACKPLV